MNTAQLSTESAAVAGVPIRPEFFKLPGNGGDPFFGLSRSWYLETERTGAIQLVRLRRPGSIKGRVLVPYQQVTDLIRKMGAEAAAQSTAKKTSTAVQSPSSHRPWNIPMPQ